MGERLTQTNEKRVRFLISGNMQIESRMLPEEIRRLSQGMTILLNRENSTAEQPIAVRIVDAQHSDKEQDTVEITATLLGPSV